jgi:choline dehydrogenase-like flavoprotein
MIRTGASLPDGGETEVDLAIVGAGPVGIAIATSLMGRIGRIALIEAGDAHFRPAQSAEFFTAAEIDDPRHLSTSLYRRRMLGGTTSIWGGRCTPFDQEDFAPSAERPGWPIPHREMDAHVREALEFFDAGRQEYSAAVAMPERPVPLHAAATDLVVDRIERWSKPTDVWRKFGPALTLSPEVTVIHEATCTNVLTTEDGSRAVGVELRTPTVRSHKVLARTIVLACAGLETPRLLLASRASRSCGLGNELDLVGRFYMAHLASDARNVGTLRFAKPETARAFDFTRMADGIYGRRMILLAPEARRREAIGNIVFRPSRPPIDDAAHGDPVLSTMFLAKSVLIPPEYMRSLAVHMRLSSALEQRAHLTNVVTGLPTLCGFGVDWLRRRVFAARKLPAVFLYRKDGAYPLEFNAEQIPNRESRVLLGRETDPFGVPRLVVQWRMREEEVPRLCRAYQVLAAAVAKSGLGRVELDTDLSETVQRALVPQGGVHIGTVRMGADPRSGVVDQNGEVWGTRGLFVAGTAIFPTSGFASPTLTAVALAFRLAERLVKRETAAKQAAMLSG